MDQLRQGLAPFVEREVQSAVKAGTVRMEAVRRFAEDPMLSLYHLFSGVAPGDLAGVDAVMAEAEVKRLPKARRVVLVGNKISLGNPATKPDDTVVRTLWCELAWQLGYAAGGVKEAKKAFARIAEEVVAHLSGLVGANVTVTLEIQAEIPSGAPDNVVRIVTENCRTLKFSDHGFEKE